MNARMAIVLGLAAYLAIMFVFLIVDAAGTEAPPDPGQ